MSTTIYIYDRICTFLIFTIEEKLAAIYIDIKCRKVTYKIVILIITLSNINLNCYTLPLNVVVL